jgi:hypothetical protein
MPRRHFRGGAVAGLCRFQFGHAFGEVPQGAIELYVLIDRFHFAGGGTAAVAVGVMSPCGKSAPDGIFLNPVEGPPKISAVIIAAARLQQLSRGDGRVDFAFGISEPNHVSGFRKCGLLSAGERKAFP